jgi:mRNA interferase MazF
VKRGEIWTAAGGADYAGKPRPFLVVQDDDFPGTASIMAAGFTTYETEAAICRIEIVPSTENGLRAPCRVMIDKMAAIPKEKLGERIGALPDGDMERVNRAMLVFLGLAAVARG